jgi:flagellar hook assembly protein FlgD
VRPNPLQVGTSIQLALPAGADVSLDIYDVQGRKVAALMSGRLSAGYHTTDWKGSDEHGNRLSAGAYFCRLRVNGQPMLMQKLMKL